MQTRPGELVTVDATGRHVVCVLNQFWVDFRGWKLSQIAKETQFSLAKQSNKPTAWYVAFLNYVACNQHSQPVPNTCQP